MRRSCETEYVTIQICEPEIKENISNFHEIQQIPYLDMMNVKRRLSNIFHVDKV